MPNLLNNGNHTGGLTVVGTAVMISCNTVHIKFSDFLSSFKVWYKTSIHTCDNNRDKLGSKVAITGVLARVDMLVLKVGRHYTFFRTQEMGILQTIRLTS